ncbi:MAG: hypothetical protein M1825_005425 [Sarcosagium campestre]|nr:MAG: hypothetical protein M1825_005425 [Sarcosagium campestre]
MPYMDRIVGNQDYSLINFVNKHVPPREQIRMIPYIYDANNTFLLYNNVLRKYQDPMSGDPFKVGSTSDGAVPANFAALDPTKVWGEAIKEFTDALSHSFEDGFKKLMAFDSISVRKYLQDKNYTHAEIDWLEAFGDSTGNYNAALSEQVIEAWIFTAASSWTTIEGGFSRLINGMLNCIRKPVRFAQRVVKISYAADRSLLVSTEKGMTFQYSHVINTAPLGAVQAMDMTKLDLEYDKVTAIRGLNYDASTKIGIKFSTRWWQDLPASIVGGESLSDLLIRHCVYPSYGVDTEHAAAAMIASYTWGQDAERLSGYLSTARGRSDLIELTLKDLEKMNGLEEGYLRSQYVESFAFSWNDSPYALGAFALFSPGQFSSRLPSLLKPAAEGRLHFAGEALSSGHGWIIGALNSAYRAVAEILAREGRTDLLEQLSAQWGTIDEIDMGWYSHSAGENVKPPTSAPPPPAR